MWAQHDGMGWWMLFGGMGMIFFWAVVIWFAVWGVARVADRSGDRAHETLSPIDIVKERLARGEITRNEFEELKRTLE